MLKEVFKRTKKGIRGTQGKQGRQEQGGNPQVGAIIYCNERAKVRQESGSGQYLGMIQVTKSNTRGLALAWMLRPMGCQCPISERTKEVTLGRLLDIT